MTNEEYMTWLDNFNIQARNARNKEKYASLSDGEKEARVLKTKQWRHKNADKVRATRRKWARNNLSVTLRCRMSSAIKTGQKAGSAVRDLGCTIDEFKAYIASKFTEGMSWDNHGKWHLDHIRPLASFDLTDREQFLKAAHYTNYQPLWARDNLTKGAS